MQLLAFSVHICCSLTRSLWKLPHHNVLGSAHGFGTSIRHRGLGFRVYDFISRVAVWRVSSLYCCYVSLLIIVVLPIIANVHRFFDMRYLLFVLTIPTIVVLVVTSVTIMLLQLPFALRVQGSGFRVHGVRSSLSLVGLLRPLFLTHL